MRQFKLFFMLLFLTACSGNNASPGGSIDGLTKSGQWTINLSISGGFAGVVQSIEIDQNGLVVARDLKRGVKKIRYLSPEELSQFRHNLLSVPDSNNKTTVSKCNDCFHYNFGLIRETTSFQAAFDSTAIEALSYAPLLRSLATLTQQILAP